MRYFRIHVCAGGNQQPGNFCIPFIRCSPFEIWFSACQQEQQGLRAARGISKCSTLKGRGAGDSDVMWELTLAARRFRVWQAQYLAC